GLTIEEVRRRLEQFQGRGQVWLTRAATFLEKSHFFPDCVFVVGLDTAERILDPRFYGASSENMREALQAIGRNGCRFLVGGRVDSRGLFRERQTLTIP